MSSCNNLKLQQNEKKKRKINERKMKKWWEILLDEQKIPVARYVTTLFCLYDNRKVAFIA